MEVRYTDQTESEFNPKLVSFPGGIPHDLGADDAWTIKVPTRKSNSKKPSSNASTTLEFVDPQDKVKFVSDGQSKADAYQYAVGLYDPSTNTLTVSKCPDGVVPLTRIVSEQEINDKQEKETEISDRAKSDGKMSAKETTDLRAALVRDFGNKKSKQVVREAKLNQSIIEASSSNSDAALKSAVKRAIKEKSFKNLDTEEKKPAKRRRTK
jgi:hypothetical protein